MRFLEVFHIFCVGDVSVVIYLFTISLFLFVKIRCLLLLLQISTSAIFKHREIFHDSTWTRFKMSRLSSHPHLTIINPLRVDIKTCDNRGLFSYIEHYMACWTDWNFCSKYEIFDRLRSTLSVGVISTCCL